MRILLFIVIGLVLSACATTGWTLEQRAAWAQECRAKGLIPVVDYRDNPKGCMTQEGFERLFAAEAANRPNIDPLAAFLILQGMQQRQQYTPLPIQPVPDPLTCVHGGNVTTCY